MAAWRLSLLSSLILLALPAGAADLLHFWDEPRRGANSFNRAPPDAAYFEALARTGASWVRLTFSKWDGAGPDFLLGDADRYTGLPAPDLAILVEVLDAAHEAGLKVVVVPLSLPGARWRQQNGGRFDDRLWSDRSYWAQAAQFWADLASALEDHPAVAAYNIVNEPAPERTQPLAENVPLEENRRFIAAQAGSARDLPAFYERVIDAIRDADSLTPVMVEGGFFANPRNLAAWPGPLRDERVLYAFHMYEPYAATSAPNMQRKEPLRYPGTITEYAGEPLKWDAVTVKEHIATAFRWAASHDLPPTRVVGSEFGCMRRWADCGTYLEDVVDAVESFGGHWAFYAFREDAWDGMDYELPADFPPGRFYWLMQSGQFAQIPRDGELMHRLLRRVR